ncbi:hypothetical protein [Motiliproteus sp. MSK22-1]|uniref:hypothetical protein n=1 Tax=Motiliproteus sp. MSK22-1 TaxID=1897630 RepID=UPI0009767570|nr:hypothetical protein [Motiliproteus sp. MSK22-1]OMH36536.1 hypothetical protein BGP75_09625 [Motiliproteus sp. MSK22-1]
MDDASRKKYYEEGASSYYDNEGELINPYPQDTDAHLEFERGWSQTLRRQSASSFRKGKQSSPVSFQDKYADMWGSHSEVGEQASNSYAEIKG